MFCNNCGKEFQPWVSIFRFTDERDNTPILMYKLCDWSCSNEEKLTYCINCGDIRDTNRNGDLCNECSEKPTFVYFIQIENDGPIKIGLSENPKRRLIGIQPSIPYKIHFLSSIKGTDRLEANIKKRFQEDIIRGEWFKPTNRLINFVKNLEPKELI